MNVDKLLDRKINREVFFNFKISNSYYSLVLDNVKKNKTTHRINTMLNLPI